MVEHAPGIGRRTQTLRIEHEHEYEHEHEGGEAVIPRRVHVSGNIRGVGSGCARMTKDRDDRKPRIAEPAAPARRDPLRDARRHAAGDAPGARSVGCRRGTLDLRKLLRDAKAVEGTVGRKTLSPRMKLVLWLYAISTGVGSAREIARLVRSDDAYRWIVGDLEVCHDTLSSFRVDHGAALDELMTDILASLVHKGVLSLDVVAQDGIRIRAAATAPSFRRLESLLECREQAALHLKAVLAQAPTIRS